MKKNPWLVAGLILIVLLAVLTAGAKWILPGVVKNKIIEGVTQGCPECALHIKSLDIELMQPGRLVLHDVKFAGGQGGHSVVEIRLETLTVDVALGKTRSENLVFDDMTAKGLEVIYADGDAPKKPGTESEGHTKVGVYHARFENALFRYAHTKNGQTSILHFKTIDGEIKNAGNTADLVDKMAEAHLTGQIEKSGHADLQIAALLRPGPGYVDIDLHLENQNLEDLNAFFTPNDGVTLKGEVIEARAKLNMRDETTKSHVEAQYKNGDYKESATVKKSAIEAGLANIGASLLMTKTNVDFPEADRQADVEVKRDKGEALVHYLLRSAKMGLLEVVKKKKK